jgi:hypothetical protein
MIASVKTGKRSGERWTPEEDQRLLVLFDAEASWPLIAITLERSVEDVQERAGKLRHKNRARAEGESEVMATPTPPWTAEEEDCEN